MTLTSRTIGLSVLGAAVLGALMFVTFRTVPVPVDLTEVASGPMQVTINADGKTQIRNLYDVASPIAGTARRAPVVVGQPVVAGQTVVAVVEPVAAGLLDARTRVQAEAGVRESQAGLAVAESQLAQAREDVEYARQQYARAQELVNRGVASVTRLEDADAQLTARLAALDAARSRLAMARSSVERAEAALLEPGIDPGATGGGDCCIRLTAPVDGVVLSIDEISERPVQPGATLVSLGDPRDLEIVADLLSSDAIRVAPGTRAIVDRWGGDAPLGATIRSIDPIARTRVSALGIEEQRVDVRLDLTSPPDERPGLGHGFSVFLRLVVWAGDDIVQVPLSALFRRGDQWHVFTVAGDRARLVPVETGQRNDTTVQILSGIEPGVPVITHPSDAISDGTAVVQR